MKNRIFIGISETSGFYGRLYCGLKDNGVDCFFSELIPNKHNYKYKYKTGNIITNLCKYYYDRNWIVYYILKSIIFLWALFRYDTFVFTACESFWNNRELWIYRILKKKTIMICLGRITRLAYANGTDVDTRSLRNGENFNINYIVRQVEERKHTVERIEQYVDVFINLPAQAQLNEKPFVSLAYIGIPLDLDDREIENKEKKNGNETVKILHAASTVGCRGTIQFRKCIEELRKEYEIEYVEITKVPNEVVIEKIRECDFVLDELWSDTPLATFASEAAYFAKPTIVCGYFSKEYKKYYPEWSFPPSMYVAPSELKNSIRFLIEHPKERKELGRTAQEFVKKYIDCR